MSRTVAHTGLAVFTLLLLSVGTDVLAAGSPSVGASPEGLKEAVISPDLGQTPGVRPFKLKGGGQIDINTFGFSFAGQSTHLGQYVATGQIDPSTFQIQGSMTAANGDILNWLAYFVPGPLGEIEATFTFTGGTGRFVNASGSASGQVALDPDFMFTLNLEGTIAY